MSVDPSDFISRSMVSDCCQMPVMSGGMCSGCHEHCESEPEDGEEPEATPEQLRAIEELRAKPEEKP